MSSRLVVASVRLPVSVKRDDHGWSVEDSPGGLATALRAVSTERPFTWVGWPGAFVPKSERDEIASTLEKDHGAIPVFLEEKQHKGFYREISNRVLWPLFHNLPETVHFDWGAWTDYCWVNQQFAEAIARVTRPGDTVWVHDYQLALVPEMLREAGLECALGFFLHIPFPSSETFRALPVREPLLRGMAGADLAGFHTYDYARHFRSSALRVLGSESDPEVLKLPTHDCRLGVLPIGIDPAEVVDFSRLPEVEKQRALLEKEYEGRTVVLGVDRLDYTKGIPHKLRAFARFLDKYPDLRKSVVLIQVASPSRTRVQEYKELKAEVDQLVGQINGRFGSARHTPVVYINRHVERSRLTALYQLAKVMLVTPVRDGMNLVALEYIAARQDNPGTLLLSEFAGAASCLAGAELINPHNTEGVADALAAAVREAPKAKAFAGMSDFVHSNTAVRWAKRFVDSLEAHYQEQSAALQKLKVDREPVRSLLTTGEHPLVLLDYDGTLVPHVADPDEAAPTKQVRDVLAGLAEVANVFVVSGRPRVTMEEWLGDLHIGLVCEHGWSLRTVESDWSPPPNVNISDLESIVRPTLEAFTERTPGSFIEEKAGSLVWHYRRTSPQLGVLRARELRATLDSQLAGRGLTVLPGSRVVEVRPVGITKGEAAWRVLELYPDTDFVFAAGNDTTDLDMFEAIGRMERPYLVCQVGRIQATGDYFVQSPQRLLAALEQLIALRRG